MEVARVAPRNAFHLRLARARVETVKIARRIYSAHPTKNAVWNRVESATDESSKGVCRTAILKAVKCVSLPFSGY